MEDNIYEIIYMVRMGDPSALNILMDSFHETIACHVRRFCKDHPYEQFEQDDLIQEGMISLYGAAGTYRYDKCSSFDTYAYLLFENRLKNISRHARTNKEASVMNVYHLNEIVRGFDVEMIELIEQSDCLSMPEYVFAMKEAYDLLCETVMEMTEKQKMAVADWAHEICLHPYGKNGTKEDRRRQAMVHRVRQLIRNALEV